jgi:subtilisin family serine protease
MTGNRTQPGTSSKTMPNAAGTQRASPMPGAPGSAMPGAPQGTQPGTAQGMPSGPAQGRGQSGGAMGGQARDTMPRPASMNAAAQQQPGGGPAMASASAPRPGQSPGRGAGATARLGDAQGPGGGAGVPRFPSADRRSAPRFEPGVVEVQFREGMQPSVVSGRVNAAPALHSAGQAQPGGVTLDDVNQILQRYQLVSAEPTFSGTVEEATSARATAQLHGIDAPHLSDFVTLHFPADANVSEIADQLNQLPQVERAVPVPSALPPIELAEAPPEMRMRAPREAAPERPARELPPTGAPLAEPLVGSSDQVVTDPVTGLENQWYVFRCRADQAWNRASGSNVVIADVDWGCRTSHQDLAAHIGQTYNAYDGSATVTSGGSVFHGTGVLGLAGAAVNGVGMAGFGFDTELWPVQADSGTGPALGGNAWARGIDWVRTADSGGRRKVLILEVQTGAFGNYEQVPSVNAAIKTAIGAGVVVCVAAGNGDRDAGIDDGGNPIPATGSILVGATGYDAASNQRAWFSNFGAQVVVAAPGDSDHDLTCDSSADNAYRNGFGGTSGATPKVAGVAALMLAANPVLTHAQLRGLLNASGSVVTTDPGKPVGTFLDADAAVRRALVGAVGRMEVFARGGDGAVWHIWQTAPNNGWSGWDTLGGWVDIIKTGRNADGRLEIFARGGDGAVWHNWQTAPNNGWSGWDTLGGWVDLIEVAQNQDGRLEVFARGGDGALWHNWQTAPNNGWSGWASMGGWIDLLSVGQNQDGRLEVFARGGDGALWHNWQTAPNNGWSGWASLGGWIDLLDVGRNADGRIEVFARGGDGALWHNWQTAPNNGWSGWASMGGWIDQLDVARNEDGRLEAFARGGDQAVWHQWQTAPNNGWSGWDTLGGWIDRLSLSQNEDGRLEVFARGGDGALWHQWQVAPNNGWSGWASLGGWIDSVTVAQNAP